MIVTDSRSPRDGAFLKIIGHYNPLTNPATLVVKEDEAVHWLEKGAQPSETAAKLLTRIGVMERAGRQPVRYEGKDVPAAPKKEAKAAADANASAVPAPKAEKPTAAALEEPAATETSAEDEQPTPEPEVEAEPVAEPEPEPEAKEEAEAEPEPDATSEEQPQEPAEPQE
jgi:small subunit ribosomal protein S16